MEKRDKITKDELREAYIKYKAHVYYDTTELFQRRKLAEFESNLLSDEHLFRETPYARGISNLSVELETKFERIIDWINTNHTKRGFDQFLDKIDLLFLPKKYKKTPAEDNYITNERISESYTIDSMIIFCRYPSRASSGDSFMDNELWLQVGCETGS